MHTLELRSLPLRLRAQIERAIHDDPVEDLPDTEIVESDDCERAYDMPEWDTGGEG